MFMTVYMKSATAWLYGPALALGIFSLQSTAGTFRVATYNVESYLDAPAGSRTIKSEESKAKIRENIAALHPDVLALQEMGSVSALMELRDSLKENGLDLPYWQLVTGSDTNIHVALLSRFVFSASRPHTNENFLLNGRRFRVSRGFAEVDIEVEPHYTFTLIAAHLKSKRAMAEADEAELRLEEAKLLREKIDARLATDPGANLVVLGDFNDTKDSASTREVIGRGKSKLVDTRPAERNGDEPHGPGQARERRCVTWTHYYNKEDSYRRIDFLLISRGMAKEWVTDETYVLATPNWGIASDHRPLVATFESTDR
jgi:endonuclease/exonuclease/phosphatase family metal-dependent hydrolase